MAAKKSTAKKPKPRDPKDDYITGRSPHNFAAAAEDAGKKALIKFKRSPITLRMVDIEIDVKNPITEYRMIFGPTG